MASAQRFERLRARMAETGTDLLALGPGTYMRWLIGYNPLGCERPCLLLVSQAGEYFVMPSLNAEGTREHTDIPFAVWKDEDGPKAALHHALEKIDALSAKKVVVDETMRADFALLVLKMLPEAEDDFTLDTIGILRMRKDAAEIAALKACARLDDEAMRRTYAAITPAMTEAELTAEVNDAFIDQGAKLGFAITASGHNGAFPHHTSGSRQLQRGDAIVIDIGCNFGGFPSDMTRMAVVGEPPEGYMEIHTIVEQAVQAALEASKPGNLARDVDKAARDVITKAGYGEFFVHRTGHGMGIDGHEPPYISASDETVLDEGMVYSIEPGIYLPGRFGVRLEDIVVVRANGPEILSELPRDLFIANV